MRAHDADFGPTFAAEKLAERHGRRVSRETLRQWMIADGLWVDRHHRLLSPHQPRRRRDCLGELVQIDGCEHAWFEDRGPPCTLLAYVDDATSRFGRDPANAKDLHRPLSAQDDLDEALAWRETRTVTVNLVLHDDRMTLLLDPTPQARGLARKQVEAVNYPDGRFAVRHAGADLPFRVFDTIATVAPGTMVEHKRLGEALAHVQARARGLSGEVAARGA